MLLTVPIPLPGKTAEAVFKTDVRFRTRARASRRAAAISEAFGIGIDDKEFVVYDNFSVEVKRGDVVYITGDSGSGKSLLLRELLRQMQGSGHEEFGKIITEKDVISKLDPKRAIIEQIRAGGGQDTEAVRILSMVGLNEAFLMLRKYHELSDGQKYRFRLAKMIDSNAETWVMDEFLSLLDRTTAKVVAYTVQKAARTLGKTLIVATSQTDLEQDLNPDARITKRFGSDVEVRRRKVRNRQCSLLGRIRIERGSIDDYNALKQFHYRDGKVMPKMIYRAVLGSELVGVIVYGPPYLALRARSIVLPQYNKQKDESWRANAQRINREVIRIWRVVVKPKYRGAGVATMLVKRTMPLTKFQYVETLAVMARYSRFFDAAGMVRVSPELYLHHDKNYEKALDRLASLGFDLDMLASRKHNLRVLERLSRNEIGEVRKIVVRYFAAKKFRSLDAMKSTLHGDRDSLAKALTKRRLPYVYLVWKNQVRT